MIRYLLDPAQSSIEYSLRYLVMRARGRFTNFAGVIDVDPQDITRSHLSVQIDAASISNDDPGPDVSPHSAGFLDVKRYPLVELASRSIERNEHHLRVDVALSMNGVTHHVELRLDPLVAITEASQPERIAFFASTTIDRKDYGFHGSPVYGDSIDLSFDLRATRVDTHAAAA